MTPSIPHQRRARRLAIGYALMLVGAAVHPAWSAAPAALSVARAVLKRDPAKADSARFSGRLANLSLDGASFVRVALNGIGAVVPLSASRHPKKRFHYGAPSGAPGLRNLTLDLAHKRFAMTFDGMALGSADQGALTLVLGLETDTVATCTQIPFVQKKGPKTARQRRFGLARLPQGNGNGCDVGAPTFEPEQLLVGDPAPVHVTVAIMGTPAAGSVKLTPADALGMPHGDALCTLLDDGTGADTTAGDGVFSCALMVDTTVPQRQLKPPWRSMTTETS